MQGNNFSAAQIKAITAAGLDVKILSEKKVKCESAVPGKPAERLGAVTAIPTKEQDAARKRLLDKQSELKKEETIFERERVLAELHKGRHGQSEKEYQAGRSDAGKRISGDEKHGPASYTRRGVVDQKPTKPGEKPEHTPKLGSAEKNELDYRKSRLKKEDVEFVDNLIESGKFSDEEIEKIVEAQVARNNPEKYEQDQEKKDTRSKKQKRMDDPHIGINSPAFKKFMQQQGM